MAANSTPVLLRFDDVLRRASGEKAAAQTSNRPTCVDTAPIPRAMLAGLRASYEKPMKLDWTPPRFSPVSGPQPARKLSVIIQAMWVGHGVRVGRLVQRHTEQ